MKLSILLLMISVPLVHSCTKTKFVDKVATVHDTISVGTPPIHDSIVRIDTTIIKPTVIGSWQNGTETMVFDRYYFMKNGGTGDAYLATSDTIYLYHGDKSVTGWYGYTISKTNDTLTLWPVLLSPTAPYVYYRQ